MSHENITSASLSALTSSSPLPAALEQPKTLGGDAQGTSYVVGLTQAPAPRSALFVVQVFLVGPSPFGMTSAGNGAETHLCISMASSTALKENCYAGCEEGTKGYCCQYN